MQRLQGVYGTGLSSERISSLVTADDFHQWFAIVCTSVILSWILLIPILQPKLFSRSEQLSKRIMSSTDSPNQLIYFQRQEYTFRLFNKKKVSRNILRHKLSPIIFFF